MSALQRSMAEDAVCSLAFDGSESVLDVGCGDGFITRSIAGMVPNGYVVGVDPSPGMIAAAQAVPRREKSGPCFVRADARWLPFGQHFDVVVSFNALHWVPQQRQALSAIGSVARPGAQVLIQMVCAGARASLESVAMTLTGTATWARWFDGYSTPFVHVEPDDFAELAKSAGLQLAALTVADREWDFGSRERFAQWCEVGATAWTDRLKPPDRSRFVNELVGAYEPVAGKAGLFRFTQMRAEFLSG